MKDLTYIAGLALITAGVGLIYLPAALVTAGAMLSGHALFVARTNARVAQAQAIERARRAE